MANTQNIKTRILTFGLTLIAGLLTSFIDSFSNPAIIVLVPGVLFGLAVTLPKIRFERKVIISTITFPISMTLLWLFILGIGFVISFINNSYSNETGSIVIGLLSGFLFIFIYDQFYKIRNRKIAYLTILILGLASAFICDYLFLEPNAKELNLGKMISIWETLIGIGLTIFVKIE